MVEVRIEDSDSDEGYPLTQGTQLVNNDSLACCSQDNSQDVEEPPKVRRELNLSELNSLVIDDLFYKQKKRKLDSLNK